MYVCVCVGVLVLFMPIPELASSVPPGVVGVSLGIVVGRSTSTTVRVHMY